MKSLSHILGVLFATYFIIYPIMYFVWNFFIVETGFPQYAIPGFWVGMAGYFILKMFLGIFK